MTTLIVDIEADGLLPELTQLWQISIIDAETEELTSYNDTDPNAIVERRMLADGLDRITAADLIVLHNGLGYDLLAITKVYGGEYPIDWRKVIDTLVLARLGSPNREGGNSLEAWGERIGRPKVEHEDWTRWSFKMEHRCNEDAKITLAVYKRLKGMYAVMPEAVSIEHNAAYEVTKIMRRGFRLDVKHAETLLNELQTEQEEQLAAFQTMFPPILVPTKPSKPEKTLKVVNKRHALHGVLDPETPYCPVVVQEFNPASRQQIATRLIHKFGWKPTKFTATGLPEVSEDILRDLEYPEAKAFADYLKTDKSVGQINSQPKASGHGGGWLHHVTPEGRVHASLNSLKAITGRLSCSSPNLQQVIKDARMRTAWIAAEGKVLVGVDAEGLELRCLAHYLEPLDGGEYARMLLEGKKEDGTDVHSVVMRLIKFYDRDQTKRAEYGWLYGAGDAKLGIIATQDAYKAGKEIDYAGLGIVIKGNKRPAISTVGRAIRTRLEEGITGLDVLVNGVKERAKMTGKLKGLDGRPLWTRSEHSALNFLLQSAGIIIVKKAWSFVEADLAAVGLVEDVDYGMVMQVHDEFQFEVTPEAADTVGQIVSQTIVKAGEQLGFRCPLAGDYKKGLTWAETH